MSNYEGINFEAIFASLNVVMLIVIAIMYVRIQSERRRAENAEAKSYGLERQIEEQYISDWIKEAEQNVKIMEDSKKAARHGKK